MAQGYYLSYHYCDAMNSWTQLCFIPLRFPFLTQSRYAYANITEEDGRNPLGATVENWERVQFMNPLNTACRAISAGGTGHEPEVKQMLCPPYRRPGYG